VIGDDSKGHKDNAGARELALSFMSVGLGLVTFALF